MSSSKKPNSRKNQIFTHQRLVGRMCELCEPQLSDPTKKVFEPGCGTGNFLVEVLHRRLLQSRRQPQAVLLILSNLYGIDLDENLVAETRRRLRAVALEYLASDKNYDDKFLAAIDKILVSNIIVGDLLGDLTEIFFTDWSLREDFKLHEQSYSLASIMAESNPAPDAKIALRPEQAAAVEQTFSYWQSHHDGSTAAKFLWNAKPRFGKTFTAYQFAERILAERILIVSNRPAISDSWLQDYVNFVAPRDNYIFASAKGGDIATTHAVQHVYSRTELLRHPELLEKPLIFFISLQDLKGKDANGDFKSKNQWIFKVQKPWDLLIIDESHDGIRTPKTRHALSQIHTNFTLSLSGTPFRALADNEFSDVQIFNWTYLDEQTVKAKYSADNSKNPYRALPQLNIYAYNLADYFSETLPVLNFGELFRAKNGHFIHADFVQKWLDLLSKSLPFATPASRQYFRHTFWLFSHVEECRAMAKLLAAHPFFRDYQVVIVAGKDRLGADEPKTALARVRRAINQAPDSRTITLSCGQLTTGVTVPEWTGVLMLGATSNLQKSSSTQYLQAAFRAQNPWQTENFTKEQAYVFDWSPDRAMLAFRDYAMNLCAKPNDAPIQAISALARHLPFYISQPDGEMSPLSPQQILDLPTQLAAAEIVDGNFVSSDKLFRLENVFQLSPAAHQIINKIYGLKKHGFESAPQPIPNPIAPTAEEKIISQKPFRSHKKQVEDDYRAKLRGFTSAIPFLIHLYGKPGQSLSQLVDITPNAVFTNLVGISKADFSVLSGEHFFHEENCAAAIQEFLHREHNFANYINSATTKTVFKYIPMQRQYIFTPSDIIERMLDYLEMQRPNLFMSPNRTFLDLCSKSGLFSAAVIRRLFHHLRPSFSSDRECLFHILTHQIYTWSPDLTTQNSTLQTILGFQRFDEKLFSDQELAEIIKHFVIYNPSNGKEIINYVKVEQKIAEFWEDDVKFDIILGNPPYQSGRRQVYADFYRMAVDLNPELLCLIFPQGWQKATNTNGLKQLNNVEYKRDSHLVLIDHYYENDDRRIFPEIGTGGVNIVLRDSRYNNHGRIRKFEYGQEINSMILPIENDEVTKPSELDCLRYLAKDKLSLASLGSARRPYGFSAEPLRQPQKYHLKLQNKKQQADDVRLFGLFANGERGYKYISRSVLPKVSPNLDRYKLFVPKAWGNMSRGLGLGGSYSNICLACPGDACTETFIEFGPFADQAEALKMAKYFMTKLFRACLFLAKTSQNTARDKYRYVPLPDFSLSFWQKEISQIDEALFAEYQIPEASRKFIRGNFQTRTENNIDIL